ITALSTTRSKSPPSAGKRFAGPPAADTTQDLVNSADADVVAFTVKVPHHFDPTSPVLNASNAVSCEWPLGKGLQASEDLAAVAKVFHDCEDGRKQAHDRGGPSGRHRIARGRGRILDPLSRRRFACHEPTLGDPWHRG